MQRNRRKKGCEKENLAKIYLEKNGVKIIETNFRNRFGEIDLIGYDKKVLVFFEVKFRNTDTSGSPEASVNTKKQRTICLVSDYYRMIHHISLSASIRYDVIAMDRDEIRWIKGAFGYIR